MLHYMRDSSLSRIPPIVNTATVVGSISKPSAAIVRLSGAGVNGALAADWLLRHRRDGGTAAGPAWVKELVDST